MKTLITLPAAAIGGEHLLPLLPPLISLAEPRTFAAPRSRPPPPLSPSLLLSPPNPEEERRVPATAAAAALLVITKEPKATTLTSIKPNPQNKQIKFQFKITGGCS